MTDEGSRTGSQRTGGSFAIRHLPHLPWVQMPALVILFFGLALRATPLTQNRFHPDEALYATFARLIASGRDPLLSTVVVDKPPLPFYLTAASMALFGAPEFAARLPFFFASVISIALLYQLGRALYSRPDRLGEYLLVDYIGKKRKKVQ